MIDAAPPLRSVTTFLQQTAHSFRFRGRERGLLLWNAPLFVLAAAGIAAGQRHPGEAFPTAMTALGTAWFACFGLHLLLCLTRFNGDSFFLPLLSLLFLIGAAYHIDLPGPGSAGLSPGPYTQAVLVAVVVLAVVTMGGPWFKRLSMLLEEQVWWRIAKDRPYYESVPFHLLLVALMVVLAVALKLGGVQSSGGALIQVRLPGGFSFTPSEFIRLAVAFFLADYLGRNSRVMRNLAQPVLNFWPLNRLRFERRFQLMVMLITVGLYCAFFYLFRDFGPAVIIIVLSLAALYAATSNLLTPLLIGGGLAGLIALFTTQNIAFGTMRRRLEMWVNPWDTHFTNGDHMARILWSIASGGWYGMGVGTQNLPHTLPLARNDAAFAGIAATMGMWTGLALLAIYAAITWRGMLAARRAPTDRSRLLGFTLTSLLAFQAIWICGAMVRVFPFTGINVPFISTGLSSMIASALALGALWNISRLGETAPEQVDTSDATVEVQRGVTRLARPITAAFALPAVGLLLHGCPWLLGDRTLTQPALARDRQGERVEFNNPYLERFRRRFSRGRVFSADGKLLAVSRPTREELEAIRELNPELAARAAREDDDGERYYPLGPQAAQLIGWNAEGRFAAQQGSVERTWDGLLRGYKPSELPFFFRNRHNPLVTPPRPQDLQLTISAELQRFATERLDRAVREWNGSGGALVVFDATSGEVLAAVTAPHFDPNTLSLERMRRLQEENPRSQVLVNKALASSARYFPGSAFKILTGAAALDEGIDRGFTCRHGRNAETLAWEYDGIRWRREAGKIRDYGSGSHGGLRCPEDMVAATARSCNVYFAGVATELGPERLLRAMRNAELERLPTPRELAERLPYAGFGQGDLRVTPLELAQLAGAFGAARPDAVESTAARPYWVKYVVHSRGRTDPEGLPGAPDRKIYQPFPPRVMQQMREAMVAVVQDPNGTAHEAFYRGGSPRLPGVTVGGKTGTAEFDRPAAERARRGAIGRHAWFVGFARSDHELEPRTLGFAVLVEDVRRGGTGGRVCAPVARDVIDRILPDPGEIPNTLPSALERFYQQQIRPRFGPFTPMVDWLRERLRRR